MLGLCEFEFYPENAGQDVGVGEQPGGEVSVLLHPHVANGDLAKATEICGHRDILIDVIGGHIRFAP